jgi:hypothetical protein
MLHPRIHCGLTSRFSYHMVTIWLLHGYPGRAPAVVPASAALYPDSPGATEFHFLEIVGLRTKLNVNEQYVYNMDWSVVQVSLEIVAFNT